MKRRLDELRGIFLVVVVFELLIDLHFVFRLVLRNFFKRIVFESALFLNTGLANDLMLLIAVHFDETNSIWFIDLLAKLIDVLVEVDQITLFRLFESVQLT